MNPKVSIRVDGKDTARESVTFFPFGAMAYGILAHWPCQSKVVRNRYARPGPVPIKTVNNGSLVGKPLPATKGQPGRYRVITVKKSGNKAVGPGFSRLT